MAFKFFLYFLLNFVLGIVCGHSIFARSSSAADPAPQTCGTDNTNFYCPVDEECKPRSQRCTHANVCNNPSTNREDGCHETAEPGLYEVRLGHVLLFESSGSKVEHQFIEYRGFTYELGKYYGIQILDTADPQYKYPNNMKLGIETVGYSYCTWEDATQFTEKAADKKYNLVSNTCQHFANGLRVHLTGSSCNEPPYNRKRSEDRTTDLDQEIDNILQNCSIVCCYDNHGNTMSPIMILLIFSLVAVVAIV